MNEFRSRILGGLLPEQRELMGAKRRKGADCDAGLASIAVPRSETRTSDTREGDRHRLPEEAIAVTYDGAEHPAQLINLSGGGAMIAAEFAPLMWDRMELHLGENGTVEAAVRWVKNGRIGLEFAHETRIDCSPEERNAVLNAVIAKSFPDVAVEPPVPADLPVEPVALSVDESEAHRRVAPRHPLVWSGLIHFDHDSTAVRLRNISSSGALIETARALPTGADLLLDLGDAGTMFATVSWTVGDQAGLSFKAPFDLGQLAKTKPAVAPSAWAAPAYLRDDNPAASPWTDKWGRLTVSELQTSLEGYLKH